MKSLMSNSLVSILISTVWQICILYSKPTGADTAINAYTDANCIFRPRTPQVGPPTGDCQQILTPNTISVDIESLDRGCTVTFYSDEYCTDNMLETPVGKCDNLKGTYIRSFSIDECPPGTPNPLTRLPNATMTTAGGATRTSPSTATSSASAPAASSGGSNRGAVIGGAVGGGIGLIAVVGAIVFYFCRKDRRKPPPEWPHTGPARGRADLELEAHPIGSGDSAGVSDGKLVETPGRRFENHAVVEELPTGRDLRIPMQELEAPVPTAPGFPQHEFEDERLPDMPRLPGPHPSSQW